MDAAELIRVTRRRHGLSQAQLALRAGTGQSAISRLERGEVSPSIETVESLSRVMGEELELAVRPMPRAYDRLHRRTMDELTPDERLARAVSWNRMAGEFAAVGRKARDRPVDLEDIAALTDRKPDRDR